MAPLFHKYIEYYIGCIDCLKEKGLIKSRFTDVPIIVILRFGIDDEIVLSFCSASDIIWMKKEQNSFID